MTEVFISFKNTHAGKPTRDQVMAEELYEKLKENDISVFFSNSSLSELGASEYKNAIDAALTEAHILVLVGTKKEYISSRWVHYEWDTFMQEVLSERKQNGKIFTYLEDMSVSELPIGLRSRQSFSTQNSIDSIVEYIRNSLDPDREVIKKELPEGVFAYYGINQRIDYSKALEILSEFEEDDTATYLLGQMHYYGDAMKRDLAKAVELFARSAERGNIMAGYKLAECYKRGVGTSIDFAKHDELKTKLANDYSERIETLNKSGHEYKNNLVYIGRTNKGHITKEAILALEIRTVLELLDIEVELFDVDINNEEKVGRVDEIQDERNMFIFSNLRNVNDSRMETIWKSMFTNYELSIKTAITHISEIQVHDIPAYLRKTPFIIRDANSMSKIASFFMRGKDDQKQ